MSRIAFVWELGSSLGHLSVLLPFARKLKQRGHDVVIVLRELQNVGSLFEEIPVLQAPLCLYQPKGLAEPPLSYSEILVRFGYSDAKGLAGLVGGWRALFALHNSDLIVADHSPTALLAAHSMGLAATTLGSGFYLPPSQNPLPNMRSWLNVPRERLEGSDAHVLTVMNTVLSTCGAKPLSAVYELFKTVENFLCTFAELDHYPQREPSKYWGACYNLKMGQAAAWPNDAGLRVFVYLDPNGRDFINVLEALTVLGCCAFVCAPGIAGKLRQQYESPRITISAQPFRLDKLQKNCDLAIGYAGHAMTAGMLMAGVPLLLLPRQLEQFLLATRVAALGGAITVNPDAPPPDYLAVIRMLVEEPAYRAAAKRFASQYADFNQQDQQEKIVDRIEQIAATKQAGA
ncbi:MAG: hypothetical protein U1C96_08200 [Gallionella sp.]|nr:hypothetical protein [Gallionella sp.]